MTDPVLFAVYDGSYAANTVICAGLAQRDLHGGRINFIFHDLILSNKSNNNSVQAGTNIGDSGTDTWERKTVSVDFQPCITKLND